jgi:hypothetical protein
MGTPTSRRKRRAAGMSLRFFAGVMVLPLTAVALLVGQSPDTREPSVAITSPAEDAGVSGVVAVRATAIDNVGVAGVQFQVDLEDFGAEDTEAPFEVTWNADAASPGAHILSAIARDAAGNVTGSDLLTVIVCGPSVQPCPSGQPAPPPNRPPVAVGDVLTSTGGAPVSFDEAFLLANDTDPDNHALTVTTVAASSTQGGSIASNGGGSWTYTPAAGFVGNDTFIYSITDGVEPASAVVTVTVTAPAAAGLVAHYTFDESDPANLTDLSGRGNHGVITGAVRVGGISGNALQFDGVNDWVTVADSASLDLSTALSIEAWVKPAASSGNWRTVVLKERIDGLAYSLYAHDGAPLAGGTNVPAGYVHIGTADLPVRGAAALPLNAWSHIALTYGAGSERFYVNGVEVDSRALTGTTATTAQPLRIGGNSIWGEFFSGLIDEVRIYNRALSGAEVAADMNTTPPPAPVNRPPVAVNDSLSTTTDASVTVSEAALLANDSDPDGDAIRVTAVSATSANGGAIASTTPGSWTYTPAAGFSGTDTFTYTIEDTPGLTDTATVTVAVNAPAPPPGEGLVAAYGFNEGSGLTTADHSGSANTGTLTGASWVAAGKFGAALSFDGVDDWVTVDDPVTLDLTTALTIEAWVKATSVTGNWRTVVMKESAGGLAYSLYAHDGGPLPGGTNLPAGYVRIDSVDQPVRGVATLALNRWTHLAVTYGGGSMRFYVDGALVATRALTGTITVSELPLRIGGNAPWGEFFDGLIDEVRIYNRVLSAAEIATDMNSPIQ